jgi:IPT/TIG domain
VVNRKSALLWTVFFASAICVGQSISKVALSSKPDPQVGKADFTLTITGSDFGADPAKINVRVAPSSKLFTDPQVAGVSKDGKVITATFTAPDTYDPDTVIVEAGGKQTEPYVASAAAGESDLQKYVRVYRSIIDPKDVADIFGRRIAKRFVVLQVTVTNRNKQYQLLIHDISLDLRRMPLKVLTKFGKHKEASSIELSLLRGVAERGQTDDPRNRILRVLRGTGTVAAGLIGVTDFGSSFAPSVAVWNGPVVSAFGEIFPDSTINQMNRLSDSAYSANSIVPRQQSKVVAVFLPQGMFLTPKEMKQFYNDPTSLPEEVDFRGVGVLVDGNFITNVEDLAPALTTATIDPDEMKKFQNDKPEVKGSISGNYLSGTDVKLLNSDLPGVKIRLDGTPTDQKIDFVVNSDSPVAPGKSLKIGISKKGQDTVKETDLAIQYASAAPTLTKITPNTVKQGDKDTVLTLTGTNFLPGANQVLCGADCTASSVDVKSSTSLEAKITVTDTASTGARQVSVVTPGGSGNLASALTVNKK